jgi:hypothetical protein
MNRFEKLLNIFNWQGGTIHQVEREIEVCLSENCNILNLSDSEFDRLCDKLEKQYPFKEFESNYEGES